MVLARIAPAYLDQLRAITRRSSGQRFTKRPSKGRAREAEVTGACGRGRRVPERRRLARRRRARAGARLSASVCPSRSLGLRADWRWRRRAPTGSPRPVPNRGPLPRAARRNLLRTTAVGSSRSGTRRFLVKLGGTTCAGSARKARRLVAWRQLSLRPGSCASRAKRDPAARRFRLGTGPGRGPACWGWPAR